MTVPQLKGIRAIVIAIFVVSISAGVANSSLHGEIHNWKDLYKALNDGLLYAVVAIFGWLGLKSPYAKQVRELFKEESDSTRTTPAGDVITEKKTTVATREISSDVKPEKKE